MTPKEAKKFAHLKHEGWLDARQVTAHGGGTISGTAMVSLFFEQRDKLPDLHPLANGQPYVRVCHGLFHQGDVAAWLEWHRMTDAERRLRSGGPYAWGDEGIR